MKIELPWPNKLLWPNGGHGNHYAVSAAKKRARNDAGFAAIKARQAAPFVHDGGEIPVRLIVRAKPRGPLPDKDNCIAAIKVQLDAIAEQIGVNDRHFSAPVVVFETPRIGTMEVWIAQPVESVSGTDLLPGAPESVMKMTGRESVCCAHPGPDQSTLLRKVIG